MARKTTVSIAGKVLTTGHVVPMRGQIRKIGFKEIKKGIQRCK